MSSAVLIRGNMQIKFEFQYFVTTNTRDLSSYYQCMLTSLNKINGGVLPMPLKTLPMKPVMKLAYWGEKVPKKRDQSLSLSWLKSENDLAGGTGLQKCPN